MSSGIRHPTARRGGRAARFGYPSVAMASPQMLENMGDVALRLIASVVVGMVIGFDREWRGKAVGIRTLGLVSLGSALVCLSTVGLAALQGQPDATSRV